MAIRAVKEVTSYLVKMDDDQLGCRARRHHNWPSDNLKPGNAFTGKIQTQRQHDGSYQVTETCLDCPKVSTWTTLPKGVYNMDRIRRYIDPDNWIRIPSEVDYSIHDLKAEHMNRIHDMIFSASAIRRRNQAS